MISCISWAPLPQVGSKWLPLMCQTLGEVSETRQPVIESCKFLGRKLNIKLRRRKHTASGSRMTLDSLELRILDRCGESSLGGAGSVTETQREGCPASFFDGQQTRDAQPELSRLRTDLSSNGYELANGTHQQRPSAWISCGKRQNLWPTF